MKSMQISLLCLAALAGSSIAIAQTETLPPAALPSEITQASWDEIKDYNYEKRAEFSNGLRKLEARVDAQVSELNARRQVMKADPKNWDFAMKEMIEAQAYLKSMATDARKANEETWEDRKEKVRLAWVRAQEAYSKVKASTTS